MAGEEEAGAPEGESFGAAMERLGGWGDDAPEETPEIEAEASEGAPAAEEETEESPEKPVRPRVVDVKPNADKHEQLAALAKELGMAVDGTKVTTAERAALREQRRNFRAKLEQEEQGLRQRLQQEEQTHRAGIDVAKAVMAAIDAGDPNALAKATGKFKDWEELNGHFISVLSDPNYRKLRELEDWKAEQERTREQEKTQREQQEQARAREEATRKYIANLSGQLKASEDRTLSGLHDDPWFVQAIYRVQAQHYDSDAPENIITPAQALRLPDPQTGLSLFDTLKSTRDRLNRALGAPEIAPDVAGNGAGKPRPRPKAPRTSVISTAERSDASSGRQEETNEQFFNRFRQDMMRADD